MSLLNFYNGLFSIWGFCLFVYEFTHYKMTSYLMEKYNYPYKGGNVLSSMETILSRVPDDLEARCFTIKTTFHQTLTWNAQTLWLYQILGFFVFILDVLWVPDLQLALSNDLPHWSSNWFIFWMWVDGKGSSLLCW